MKINWKVFADSQQKQVEAIPLTGNRYRWWLLSLFGNPYGWGEENADAADCSGAICYALTLATGLKIRTTAHSLYKKIFITSGYQRHGLSAAFWEASKPIRVPGKVYRPGEICHVAGMITNKIVFEMHGRKGGRLQTLDDYRAAGERMGCQTIIRTADLNIAAEYSGNLWYGVDNKLKKLLLGVDK